MTDGRTCALSDGHKDRHRSAEGVEERRASRRKYNRSAKGRARKRKYNRSAKGARYKALWAQKKRRPVAQAELDRVLAELAETEAEIQRLLGGELSV